MRRLLFGAGKSAQVQTWCCFFLPVNGRERNSDCWGIAELCRLGLNPYEWRCGAVINYLVNASTFLYFGGNG